MTRKGPLTVEVKSHTSQCDRKRRFRQENQSKHGVQPRHSFKINKPRRRAP